MIIHRLRPALVALLLLLSLPAHGETRNDLPVTIVPNRVDFEWDTHALFSASATRLIVTDSSGTYVWDLGKKRLVRRIIYDVFARSHALTPDEETMISGHADGKIRLWSLATGAQLGVMQEKRAGDEADEITALTVSPDGTFLVSGTISDVISVWNPKTREKLRSFSFTAKGEAVSYRLIALRLTRDLKSVIAATRTSVRRFDLATGAQTAAFDLASEKDKYDNAFFSDSLVSDDGVIEQSTAQGCDIAELRYLDLKDPSKPLSVDIPANCHRAEEASSGFGDPSLFMSPARSTLLIARSGFGEIREWDPKTRSVTRTIKWAGDAKPELIGVDKDFAKAASNRDDHLSVNDLATGSIVAALETRNYPADTLLSNDGNAILLAQQTRDKSQQQLTLWDIGTPAPKKVLLAPFDSDTTIRDFSLQAKLLAATAKDAFMLLSLDTGAEVRRLAPKEIKSPSGMRLSPDGKLAVLMGDDADDKTVTLLVDTSDGGIKRRFDETKPKPEKKDDDDSYQTSITDAAFSLDGKRLALGRFNQTIDLWDVVALKRIKQLPALSGDNADRVWHLRFTPDGKKLIASSRDSGAFLWTIDTGRPPRPFPYDDMVAMHPDLACVALSHDGSKLIAGSWQHAVSSGDSGRERSIKVWNAATGKRLGGWLAHEAGVSAVTFSPDDHFIVSASRDGTIKYWEAETGRNVATIMVSNDGHWVVLSASGLFSGNAGAANLFSLSRGLEARPLSDFRNELDRPELIEALLKGDKDHRYAGAARMLDLKKVWDSAGP